jgi:hypothetical protein
MKAELFLPFFKQGDDLADHLAAEKDTRAAFLAYAEQLRTAAGMLERLAEHADSLQVELADTHLIVVSGPAPLVHRLIADKLLAEEFDAEE